MAGTVAWIVIAIVGLLCSLHGGITLLNAAPTVQPMARELALSGAIIMFVCAVINLLAVIFFIGTMIA